VVTAAKVCRTEALGAGALFGGWIAQVDGERRVRPLGRAARMSWIATITFIVLAFTVAGCVLTARPVIYDDPPKFENRDAPELRLVSWSTEVIADARGAWRASEARFATREEAEAQVADLARRWTLVRQTRVAESDDAVTDKWVDGMLLRIDQPVPTSIISIAVPPGATPPHEEECT
jgi:hypothetical protein